MHEAPPEPLDEQGSRLYRNAFAGVVAVVLAVGLLVVLAQSQSARLPVQARTASQDLEGALATPSGSPGAGTAPAPVLPAPLVVPRLPRVEASPATPYKVSDVVVATANLYIAMPWAQAREDLERLTARADVIGLNEISPARAADLAGWTRDHPGWQLVRPVDRRSVWSGQNAVLVRTTRLEPLARGVVFGSRASMTGYRINARWITWVQLHDPVSGRGLVFIQTHMDAAVESDGRPRSGAGQRVANNLQYMRTVQRMAEVFAPTHEVVVGGDWNVDARADRAVRSSRLPYRVLEGASAVGLAGLRTTYSVFGFTVPPTSRYAGGRWIDYLALWTRPDHQHAAFTGQQELTGVNSDHNPLLAGLRLDPA